MDIDAHLASLISRLEEGESGWRLSFDFTGEARTTGQISDDSARVAF